jgi:hypothetical protein
MKFLPHLDSFELTKVEKLMILNSRPSSLAALHILIEEHEDRFSLDKMEKLLGFVREYYPTQENQDGAEP